MADKMRFPLIRSKHYIVIRSDKGGIIVYNSILNTPLFVTDDALAFLDKTDIITKEDYESYDDETKETIDSFCDSFLFLPNDIDEYNICERVNTEHMELFSAGKTIIWLDLHISDACNFGCPHCIAGGGSPKKLMSLEEAISMLDAFALFLKKHNPDYEELNIHIGSCEPLLNYKVIQQLVNYIKVEYPEYKRNILMNTNLSLVNKDMAEFFRDNEIEVCTSLDCLQTGNDKIRIYPDGRGTFNDIMAGMNIMSEVGYPIDGVSVTLTDDNYEYFNEEFIEWCKKKSMVSVAVDFDLTKSTNITNEEKSDFLVDMYNRFESMGIEFYGTWMTAYLNICNSSNSIKPVTFCRANLGENCSVDGKGTLFLCSYSEKQICNINDLDKEILPGGKYYNYVYDHLVGSNRYKECYGCELEGACVGQCEISRSGDSTFVEKQCDFYRKKKKKMLKNLSFKLFVENNK